ncbi:HpcH/HpaI aldolase/citrate lyase family protein [Microbacterium tumbae]
MRTDGAWCMLGESLTTVQLALSGFDWLCLDAQHGAFDDAAVVATMRALALLPARPLIAVRVAALSDAMIGRALDAGADIVIVPMIETVEQAESAVRAAHYPPLGRRSWGPLSGLWGEEPPSADDADAELWVMLETRAGLDAAEDILAVRGVSGVLVGPLDLSLALGTTLADLLAAADPGDPLPRIAAAARGSGVRAGAFAGDPIRGDRLAELGFRTVAVATDASVIAHGASAILGGSAAEPPGSGYAPPSTRTR